MERQYFKIESSEMAILRTAGGMFSAFVAAGQVNDINEEKILEKCVVMSVKLARKIEALIQSDGETGHGA